MWKTKGRKKMAEDTVRENLNKTESKVEKMQKLTAGQKKYLKVKRIIDVVLSGGAIVVLSPVLGLITLAIKVESPGPALFKQKRVGKDKELFEIWKFRSMRTDTPKDVPTHMLADPDQYITKTGKFLRKTSLDELPQIFNIFRGEMSIIGPRPALWNQYDLIEERDKYSANSITPGLTGWAQINGRDELEIPLKAKFDGEYVENMSFGMDVKCFLGTIGSVLSSDGVVEGGTGEMHKDGIETDGVVGKEKLQKEIMIGAVVTGMAAAAGIGILTALFRFWKNRSGSDNSFAAMKNPQKKAKSGILSKILIAAAVTESLATIFVNIKRRVRMSDQFVTDSERDRFDSKISEQNTEHAGESSSPKKILITGAGSYIGTAVEAWLMKNPEKYQVETIDMTEDNWRKKSFSGYDVVYHVAGIAHADVGSVSEEVKKKYYRVNTDLAVETAEKAKNEGVKQFIFMSSMIVYSGCQEKIIHADTRPEPLNFYGDSKWQADQKIQALADESFKVVVLRPPMIYGKGSKGNYPELAKLASKLPFFPIVHNRRSMLHIDNLCEFVKLMIDEEETGVFFPQNGEYTNTSDMVQMIADVKGHRIVMLPGMNQAVRLMSKVPGKIGQLAEKAFGDLAYDMSMSEYHRNYRVNSLRKSIELTEGTSDE